MSERICGREGCRTPLKQHQRTYCSLSCSASKGRRPHCGHTAEWPPARMALLMEMWGKGLAASDIALRMATTRNAIIGKAHRLRLTARPSPIIRTGAPPKGPPRLPRTRLLPAGVPTLPTLRSLALKAPPSMPTRHTPSIVPARPPPPQRTPEPSRPAPTPYKTCQWPITDDRPHRFCDAPVDPQHGVYCREHAKASRGSVPRPLDGLGGIAA
jgi:GcrA cell cycle regulator